MKRFLWIELNRGQIDSSRESVLYTQWLPNGVRLTSLKWTRRAKIRQHRSHSCGIATTSGFSPGSGYGSTCVPPRWMEVFSLSEMYFECLNHSYPCNLHTGCNRRNVWDFGRVFLMLNYTDITQNTYIQSWTVTEIMAIEMCGLLGCRRIVRRPWRHTCPMRPSRRDMVMHSAHGSSDVTR